MTYVVHYINRFGKHTSVVSLPNVDEHWVVWEYKQEYAKGLKKPHYPLPAIPISIGLGKDGLQSYRTVNGMWRRIIT